MLECDYLVVGTGASGMAFADGILFHESSRDSDNANNNQSTIIMIDKLPDPGGHWNNAYDFVKLHQPACYYGVASEKLEREGETAVYKYKDLSTKTEILSYYRFVMDKMLKTGRLRHFGECTYQNDLDSMTTNSSNQHSFIDKEGLIHEVKVKRRVVDATYSKIKVPSTNPPSYEIAAGVECIPINDIYKIHERRRDSNTMHFVVVGAGKTGIDAILYLLDHSKIDPDNITWVISRDAWMINREALAPRDFISRIIEFYNLEETLREGLLSQERAGFLMRLDENVWAEKYSCATIEENELHSLRSIRKVIRNHGRIKSITKTHLVMTGKKGKEEAVTVPYPEGAIFVDCSSNGLPPRPSVPIFQPGKIVLQVLQTCQTCISAALIAYIECHPGFVDDADRNQVAMPNPYPIDNKDNVVTELLTLRNSFEGYGSDPRTKNYFETTRLNMSAHTSPLTFARMMLTGGMFRFMARLPSAIEAMKLRYREFSGGKAYEHKVYEPSKLLRAIRLIFWTTCFLNVLLAVVLAVLFYSVLG